MPQPVRLLRRLLLSVLLLLVVAAFVPMPAASLEPGPVWTDTARLGGVAPAHEDEQGGAPYSPIGFVVLDLVFGLHLSGDPSGATASRDFSFPDEATARAAAHDAIMAGIRAGYAMQSAPIDQQVWPYGEGSWHDDGCHPTNRTCFRVLLMSPDVATAEGTWRVNLLLEHTY
jgi:hypothetical protein